MKIMLVEDDYMLNKVITKCLDKNDNIVHSYLNGLDAYDNLNNQYDLFILDIDIPEINGLELLQKIKDSYTNSYIIMISATIDIDMIEKAYKIGCNDYLKKPFNIKELELKLELIEKKTTIKYELFKECFYDSKLSQVVFKEEIINLTKKESKLLYLLLKNKGSVVSQDTIEELIWDDNPANGQVRQLVSRVNKKLPSQLITNRPGIGYIVQ